VNVDPLQGKARDAVRLCTARTNIFEGAVRSGKTVSSLLAWLRFVRAGPAGPLLMAGKTERTLKRNIINPLVEILGRKRCRLVAGTGELWLLGRLVYVVGANDERANEKIRGLTLAGAYVDEVTTVPESWWAMLLTRLSVEGARVFGTTNPEGPRHWLKVNYLDKAAVHLTRDNDIRQMSTGDRLDLHRFSFKLEDNPSLPTAYVEQVKRENVGLWYRRLVLGEWAFASGAVYDMFDSDRHVVRGPLPPLAALPAAGVDYGTTAPFHATLVAVTAGEAARLVVTREFRYDSKAVLRQLTDAEYSTRFRTWLGADRPDWVAVDPSAASFKIQLWRDGLSNVVDARNDVVDGIRLVSSLFATGRLVIHESCAGLLDEIPSYSWDDKAAEKGEDRPVKADDHGCDSVRYAAATSEPIWRPMISPPKRQAA